MDSVPSAGTKSGYTFAYVPSSGTPGRIDAYSLNADPTNPGVNGTAHYHADQSGVIRQNSTAVASASDSPIAGSQMNRSYG